MSELEGPGGRSSNPYAPPLAAPELETGGADQVTRGELAAFVGKNADYYWNRFADHGFGTRVSAGWNWAAMFFNLFWLLYRRMFKEFAIIMGIVVVWGVAEATVLQLLEVGDEASKAIDRVGNSIFGITMGILGNGLYLKRVRREVLRSRQLLGHDIEKQRPHLVKRGGTSWAAVLIGIGLMLALAFLIVFAVESGEVP